MFNLPTNINKRERMVRGAIGGLLLIGAVLGMGHAFAILIGVLLIAEAAVSYCGIVEIIERFKLDKENGSSNTPPSPPSP